jgi:SAM-dependent methyltransferase
MLPNEAADRFSNRADDYARYRPSYPPQVIETLRAEGALSAESVVADVGSGTGILTRQLAPYAAFIYAIEPNREMRKASLETLREYENVVVVEGRAENTGVPAGSIDLIIAAQAYHWFDPYWTLDEWRQILKEGGVAALVWNERRVSGDPFLEAYEQLLLDYGTDYRSVDHRRIGMKEISWVLDRDHVREYSFENRQELDFESLKGRLLSSSYVPKEEHQNYEAMIGQLESIFNEHNDAGTVTMVYDTRLYIGSPVEDDDEEQGEDQDAEDRDARTDGTEDESEDA